MRVLITGGAGFIGSHLARAAHDHGHEVVVLDDLSTGSRSNLAGVPIRFVVGSVVDPVRVREAVRGADAVVHLAALASVARSIANPMASHAANVTGTLTLLEQARHEGVGQVIVASSSSVYGLNVAMPKREREWVRPMSPYAVSKLAAEQYVLAYQQSFGLRTLAFRFFNVYGPGQPAGHAYAAVIPSFLDALQHGRELVVNGDGLQSRDFTYVGTVAQVVLDAVNRCVSHAEPVNLAFGTNTSINELIRLIAKLTGRTPGVHNGAPRTGDVRHSQADNAVLRSLFPAVDPVALEDGLMRTVEWFEAAA